MMACTAEESSDTSTTDDTLSKSRDYMTGHFHSGAQAERDSAFYDITLHMTPIWVDREDGYWLYVEQAVTALLDQPYRQRVYHLHAGQGDTLLSTVYTLTDPKPFAGAYANDSLLALLHPDSLVLREGCDIYLTWQEEEKVFKGATKGEACGSDLRGASYATSKATIYPDRLISWDQGFDSTGTQVWGAEKGGYEFVKQ